MKIRKTLFAAPFCIAMLLLLETGSPGQSVRVATGSVPISAVEIIRAARFGEPLVATAGTKPEEDFALAQALSTYEQRVKPDDVSSLTAYLVDHPHSGWAPALLINIGLSDLHYGYFSRAIEAWQKAWIEGRHAEEPQARALVDRAVGELARLYAELGHVERLAALFEDIGDRAVTGSATEAVQVAREILLLVDKDPRHLFICGPLALQSLLLAQGAAFEQVSFLQWYRAGPRGTNLAEVAGMAEKAKFEHRIIFRATGQVPVPAIVHWKVGHFAAIVGKDNGRYHVRDAVFPNGDLWVTPEALDSESSGYFLIPADAPSDAGWRAVSDVEALTVWGKGPTNGIQQGDPSDPLANAPPPDCPMCGYNIKEATVGLALSDTPVGYTPAIGPPVKLQISYNQREDSQPQNFSYFNVSPKWTINWLGYVTDDPNNPGASVSRYLAGGGAYYYSGYNASTGQFAAQTDDGSILVLASRTPITYRRQLKDGSVEIYAQSNGSTSYPRNVFLTQMIDPQGNALTFTYDNRQRLISLTDATGRQTTVTYGNPARPLLVTQITDPFGRSATLAYDDNGRLSSITDVLGLISSFTYDANSLVNAMTTPYGTTSFAYTAPGTSGPPRFVQVTDPMGFSEREEWLEPAPVPDSDPAATVPQGMPLTPTNQYLSYRDSFHWDKNAYVVAGCTPSGGCDYTKARVRHFLHVPPNTSLKSTTVESVKYPLENRLWYQYPGQPSSNTGGTSNRPIAIGRVLDDGTTQLQQFSYDTSGYFKLTKMVDAAGRITTFTYVNQVDLSGISQTTAYGVQSTIAQFAYNTQHRPILYTDAANQTMKYAYNAAGQLTSVTNALNQTTAYQYDTFGRLVTVTNANNVTAATFTFDAFDRIATRTDSEGWTVTFNYDATDRVTKIIYPDSTVENFTYDKLDLVSYRDRQSRLWTFSYDANRRLTATTNPAGQQIVLAYNHTGQVTTLTDSKSNVTTWIYDLEGRLIGKQYADSTAVTYTYENTTSRLKSITDALGQIRQFSYAKDDRLSGIVYLNAVNPTPNVTFTYDVFFPRVVSMTDGNGTSQYSYVPVGSLGALKLQQEAGPLLNSAITYAYDQLGRVTSRTVSGAGTETVQYDVLGRTVGHTSDLGPFTLTYLGQTSQMTQRQLLPAGSNLATTWTYLPNSGDRRLAGITNVGLATSQFLNLQFTTTPENFVSAVTETSDAPTLYPVASQQTANYNNLNQLTNISGQARTFDLNGNLLSDGQRNYAWDAEQRLTGITYAAQPGKQTTLAYDGFGRRTVIIDTPAGGGSAVTTSYIWCGVRLCQARRGGNSPTRSYYDEGEFVPGAPAQTLILCSRSDWLSTPCIRERHQRAIIRLRSLWCPATGYIASHGFWVCGNALSPEQRVVPTALPRLRPHSRSLALSRSNWGNPHAERCSHNIDDRHGCNFAVGGHRWSSTNDL
jgi:YD repeat-containing protein